MNRVLKFGLAMLALLAACAVRADGECGQLQNSYGPFDYWTEKDKTAVVDGFHFNSNVETLRSGQSSASIGADLDYVLRAVPNHARALVSLINLATREKTQKVKGANYTVDCYFDRARRFRPNDASVSLVQATWLLKNGKAAEAISQFEVAEKAGLASGNFYYNLGLAYIDVKQYDKALIAAHRAYALGFNLPGLKNRLVKAGKWSDAPPAAAAPARTGDAATEDGEAAKTEDLPATRTEDAKRRAD